MVLNLVKFTHSSPCVDKLVELLRAHNGPHYKTIVFCNTVKSCTWAAKHLAANGIPVAKYHGGIHPVVSVLVYYVLLRICPI